MENGLIYCEKLDQDLEVIYEYEYTAAEPMTMYYPGCEEEFNIFDVKTLDGKEIEITEAQEELLIDQLIKSYGG